MKKTISAICACLCLMLLASCGDDDHRTYTEKPFNRCFAYVHDITSGATATYSQVNYQLTIYYDNNEAELLINNLCLPDGTAYPTISLPGLRWKVVEGGWYEITGSNITPRVSVHGNPPVFTTFKLRYLPRYIGTETADGFCVRYTIDSKFSVTSAYPRHSVFGDTKSTNRETGSVFNTSETDYDLYFNIETCRLEITMKNSRFVQNMPAGFDIVVKNIPFEINGTTASWDVEEIIPEIGGTPYPAYELTGLKGSFDFGGNFAMRFSCNPPRVGSFNVDVNCTYTMVKD